MNSQRCNSMERGLEEKIVHQAREEHEWNGELKCLIGFMKCCCGVQLELGLETSTQWKINFDILKWLDFLYEMLKDARSEYDFMWSQTVYLTREELNLNCIYNNTFKTNPWGTTYIWKTKGYMCVSANCTTWNVSYGSNIHEDLPVIISLEKRYKENKLPSNVTG